MIDPNIASSGTAAVPFTNLLEPGEYQRSQAQTQLARQQLALGQQEQQSNALKLQQQQLDMQDAQTVRQTLAESGGDWEKALPVLAGRVQPKTHQALATYATDYRNKISEIAKRDADAKKALADVDKEEADVIGHTMLGVRQSGYSPAALDPVLSDMEQHPRYKDEVAQIRQQLSQNPGGIKPLVDHLISQSPTAMERMRQFDADAATQQDRAADNARQAAQAAIPPAGSFREYLPIWQASHPEAPANAKSQADAYAEFQRVKNPPVAGRDVPLPPAVESQRTRIAATNNATRANAPGAQLTPEGLDVAATQYAKTGVMPSLGMGAADIRKQIINRAAVIMPKLDVAANAADYQANKASLGALQKNFDAVTAFENTANKNLDLVLSQGKKIIDSGSPLINTPLRAISKGVVGDADLPAYNAARQVAINEIAKVTNSASLTAALSDSARHEVESFIPANATLGQVYKVAVMLRQDMKNRHESYAEQIASIKGRIGGTAGGAQAGPKPTHIYDPATRTVKAVQ